MAGIARPPLEIFRCDHQKFTSNAQIGHGPYAFCKSLVNNPGRTLFMWRSVATEKAHGGRLAFYVDDARFEALWRNPSHYAALFLRHGIAALIERDFSLWTDMPLAEQLFNVFRMRTLGCLWQSHGLLMMPNLAWSDERSFEFCFSGIPVGAPVAACECRTPGGNDEDRRAFLAGLEQAVKQVQPENVLIYGGREHAYWLTGNLPEGPHYTLLESWMAARGRVRATQAQHVANRNQLQLFTGGDTWAVEAQQVVV